jgi:hypothetical protein
MGKAFPFRKEQRLLTQILHAKNHQVETSSALVTKIHQSAGGFQVELSLHAVAA